MSFMEHCSKVKSKLNKKNRNQILETVRKYNNNEMLTKNQLKEIKKIDNYIENNSLNLKRIDFIKRLLTGDEIILSCVAKNPSKQNLPEKCLQEFFKSKTGYQLIKLSGKKSLYLHSDGSIKTTHEQNSPVKSIDFKFELNGKTYLISHKWGREHGGHQDNQFHELIKFLEYSDLNEDDDIIFVGLADGCYTDKPININASKILKMNTDDFVELINEQKKAMPILHKER